MLTFIRLCLEDTVVEAMNGDRQELKRGKEYLTSSADRDGNVVVFSTFWVKFPVGLFSGAVEFTPDRSRPTKNWSA